jgi:tetratricopeptide (TPR) repeat protein
LSRHDWCRNTEWNADIEAAFFAKLRRARDKKQYLRIQACTIAKRQPQVALRLLDEYFALGEHFDHAQAHVDRASAQLALGETEKAIQSYEAALAFEASKPNVLTQAYIDLPFLIASQSITARYEQALDLLQHHKSRLTFPVEVFRWNAAYALIASEVDLPDVAQSNAQSALDAAGKEHSGFRFHPTVGLVTHEYDDLCRKLSAIAEGAFSGSSMKPWENRGSLV